jgi:transcriptional regulator with XRE-family HTH domain
MDLPGCAAYRPGVAREHQLKRIRNQRNAIGKRLRIARALHDPPLTQEGLCALLETTTGLELQASTVAKIETDARSVYDFEVIALAQALGVSNDWLMGVSETGGPRPPKAPKTFTRIS